MNFRPLALTAAALSLGVPAWGLQIVAHRGASYDAPENTLAAHRLALAQGADRVETDVHLTADGRLIVIHDRNTERTTGVVGKVTSRAVADGFTGLDLQSTWPLTPDEAERVRTAGLELHVWTVDDPDVARRWIELGVRSITTNRPGWLRSQLKR